MAQMLLGVARFFCGVICLLVALWFWGWIYALESKPDTSYGDYNLMKILFSPAIFATLAAGVMFVGTFNPPEETKSTSTEPLQFK